MEDKIFEKLKKELPDIKKDILLCEHTTFKIGGVTEYFLIAKEKEHLIKAIKFAKKLKLPIFIFGGGSNLLVSDKGLKGLVIKIQNLDKKFKIQKSKLGVVIEAGAGTELKNLVNFSVEKSLQRLEWAGGLPGTLGGAVRGNAGAFGGEMKDAILKVEALDKNFNLIKLSNKQCQFSYRSSIFKKNNWIVVSVAIKLKKGDKKNIRAIVQSHIKYRRERHPLEYPNAGSIFKNCALSAFPSKLKKSFSGVVKNDPFPIVPVAYLISELGLKGAKVGKAQISKKHPNFIVNLGGAKAQDVLKLINLVKQKVKKKYNLKIETEIQFVGF